MIAWGTLAVASVDNFLKPLLIARGSSLPLSLGFPRSIRWRDRIRVPWTHSWTCAFSCGRCHDQNLAVSEGTQAHR